MVTNAQRIQANNAELREAIELAESLPDAGTAGGEDVTAETNEYTEKLATLETAITALETELEGKASGGGSGDEVATCTIEIINETMGTTFESYLFELFFVAYENGEYKGYGGMRDNDFSILPSGFDWYAEKNTINNVVCNSMMHITDNQGFLVSDLPIINVALTSDYLLVPSTPNVTHTIKIKSWL